MSQMMRKMRTRQFRWNSLFIIFNFYLRLHANLHSVQLSVLSIRYEEGEDVTSCIFLRVVWMLRLYCCCCCCLWMPCLLSFAKLCAPYAYMNINVVSTGRNTINTLLFWIIHPIRYYAWKSTMPKNKQRRRTMI